MGDTFGISWLHDTYLPCIHGFITSKIESHLKESTRIFISQKTLTESQFMIPQKCMENATMRFF